MFASLVLMVREGLEAMLLVSILVAYLNKVGQKKLNKYVYIGALGAFIVSIAVASVFGDAYKSFGTVFEGLAGLFAVIILTYMIVWMDNHSKDIKGELQKKANEAIASKRVFGLFLVAFTTVLREGVETVLFLSGMSANTPVHQIITGAAVGLLISVILAFMLFKSIYRFNLKKFFQYTGYLLLVFAAGILGQVTVSLQAAGWLPGTIMAWNTNFLISENTILGSVLHSVLGYSEQPSVLQVIFYVTYLAVMSFILSPYFKNIESKNEGEFGDPFFPIGKNYNHPVYKLFRSKWFPGIIQIPMAIIFVGLLFVALFGINIGPFNNVGHLHLGIFNSKQHQNSLFIFLVWILWLPLVSISALVLGRLWCGNFCPLRLATEFASNLTKSIIGKKPNYNPYLRVGWILPTTFILITFFVKTFDVQTIARNGAYLFIGIFVVAFLVGLFFRKGTWCSYVCPIGGWLARIARLGIIGVRPKHSVCAQCTTKECLQGMTAKPGTGSMVTKVSKLAALSVVGMVSSQSIASRANIPTAAKQKSIRADRCPMFLNPSKLDSSHSCLGCWNCVKNCPGDKAAMRVGFRMPGMELLKPYAPDKWESVYIAGLIGMYIAAMQQGIFLPNVPFVFVFLGLILTATVAFLALCKILAWTGGISFREVITNYGYIFLPMEFAGAILAMGDDALEFFHVTVPAAGILLGGGFVWSLLLAVSIIKNHVPNNKRFALSLIPIGATLIGLLLLWIHWFLSGQVIDLT